MGATESNLLKAAEQGNLGHVKRLVGKGVNVNCKNKDGNTPMHLTAMKDYLSVIKYLVENGGDVNAKNNDGYTPMHEAANRDNLSVVKYLVENGGDVNAKSIDGCTPMHRAAIWDNLSVVKCLVENGGDLNAKTRWGKTPMHLAAKEDSLSVVKYLVENGGDVNAKDRDGCTPMHKAARKDNLSVVKYLVENGGDVNAKSNNGRTPVHLAAENDNLSIVKYLVENGGDVNAKDRGGGTPMHLAASEDNLSVVKYLVENGGDVNAKSIFGKTPMHYAAVEDYLSVVKYLVENGGDVNAKDEWGKTPMHLAAKEDSLSVVKCLVENGGDANAKDKDGWTPMHLAASEDGDNWTPMHWAACKDNLSIVKYLVENGGDVNAKDKSGETPSDVASGKSKQYLKPLEEQVAIAAAAEAAEEEGKECVFEAADSAPDSDNPFAVANTPVQFSFDDPFSPGDTSLCKGCFASNPVGSEKCAACQLANPSSQAAPLGAAFTFEDSDFEQLLKKGFADEFTFGPFKPDTEKGVVEDEKKSEEGDEDDDDDDDEANQKKQAEEVAAAKKKHAEEVAAAKKMAEEEAAIEAQECKEAEEEQKEVCSFAPFSSILSAAAKHTYTTYYQHDYPSPNAKAKACFFYDLDPVFGVGRPNHALCNAIRKAALVPLVASVYSQHLVSQASNTFQKADFKFGPDHLMSMQLAMLFESTGRKSEVGFWDDPEEYAEYGRAARDNWNAFVDGSAEADKGPAHKECQKALADMYSSPASAMQRVLEVCHGLDLFRCYGTSQMQPKMAEIAADVGQDAMQMLTSHAVHAILATGDRLLSSPHGFTRSYKSNQFRKCSTDPAFCLDTVGKCFNSAAALRTTPNPTIAGEGPVRFAGCRFKLLLTAQQTTWRIHKWDESSFRLQRQDVLVACMSLIDEFRKKYQSSVTVEEAENFKDKMDALATKEKRIEDVAVRLWTSLDTLGGRELCSIINEGLRSEGRWEKEHFREDAMQRPAVLLTCLIQIHLNRNRRAQAEDKKSFPWPTGKEERDNSEKSIRNAVFRGAGMPPSVEKQEELLCFYEALADESCAGRVYRVPGLLATSMFKGVARSFLNMEGRIPKDRCKILYKILLCRDKEGEEDMSLLPMQLAYIDKTEGEGEFEFLFSAYSAFRVKSVARSKHATSANAAHVVTLVACSDNSTEDEDVPTCPWY